MTDLGPRSDFRWWKTRPRANFSGKVPKTECLKRGCYQQNRHPSRLLWLCNLVRQFLDRWGGSVTVENLKSRLAQPLHLIFYQKHPPEEKANLAPHTTAWIAERRPARIAEIQAPLYPQRLSQVETLRHCPYPGRLPPNMARRKLKPDLILLDVYFPERQRLDLLRAARQ